MTALKLPAALLLAALATPALAGAVLPIGGIFGNPAGCEFFMSGAIVGDDMLVLTPDTFSSFATACYFEDLLADGEDGTFELAASCNHEGEEGATKDDLRVVDRGRDGVFIRFEGLDEWGPMLPCPDTAGLFPSKGVPA